MHVLPGNRVFSKPGAVHFTISLVFQMFRETLEKLSRGGNSIAGFKHCWTFQHLYSSHQGLLPSSPSVCIKFISLRCSGSSVSQELMRDVNGRRIFCLLLLYLLRSSFHFWRHLLQHQMNRNKALLITSPVLTRIIYSIPALDYLFLIHYIYHTNNWLVKGREWIFREQREHRTAITHRSSTNCAEYPA